MVLGMVMFIEQHRVRVERVKKLVQGFVVADRTHRQTQTIRVKGVELVVRRLERCDDSALSGQRDEISKYRIRVVRGCGRGLHTYRLPHPSRPNGGYGAERRSPAPTWTAISRLSE